MGKEGREGDGQWMRPRGSRSRGVGTVAAHLVPHVLHPNAGHHRHVVASNGNQEAVNPVVGCSDDELCKDDWKGRGRLVRRVPWKERGGGSPRKRERDSGERGTILLRGGEDERRGGGRRAGLAESRWGGSPGVGEGTGTPPPPNCPKRQKNSSGKQFGLTSRFCLPSPRKAGRSLRDG